MINFSRAIRVVGIDEGKWKTAEMCPLWQGKARNCIVMIMGLFDNFNVVAAGRN